MAVLANLPSVMSLTRLFVVSITSPAGNPQRPLRGGHHERRLRGAATRHQSPPRRPTCQAHLLGGRPVRALVPQVVGPLPPDRARGPLRPDTGSSHRPAHLARTSTKRFLGS